jgi:hypothetical protein
LLGKLLDRADRAAKDGGRLVDVDAVSVERWERDPRDDQAVGHDSWFARESENGKRNFVRFLCFPIDDAFEGYRHAQPGERQRGAVALLDAWLINVRKYKQKSLLRPSTPVLPTALLPIGD